MARSTEGGRTAGGRASAAAPDVPASITGPQAAPELEEIVNLIGPKVAGLRKAQGLSLQQLATTSDVSAAAIHKIERSGMVPTITTLLKLASALGVPVSYFVQEQEPLPEPVHLTRADSRRNVYTPHQGLHLNSVSGSYRQFQAAAAVAVMEPGANSGDKLLRHPGEELVFVLSGEVTFLVGEQRVTLGPGDALHFSGEVPHEWTNASDEPADMVWIALRGES